MFIQIHTLTSYHGSLLNRDDAGLAKRIPFGDSTRLRISSQCLKRHWRQNLKEGLPDIPDGMRTRHFFTRVIHPRLVAAGVPEELATELSGLIKDIVIKESASKKDAKKAADLAMSQAVLFSQREAEHLTKLALDAYDQYPDDSVAELKKVLSAKDMKKNLEAMTKSASLTGAMFGRFVTSDILARVDAPVHVAHAFTVHAAHTEMDYFTVVDDLNLEEETGAAHANEAELGSGVYYGYVVIDVPLLVSNLTGCDTSEWQSQDASEAQTIIRALIHAVAEQTPGAKLGSTAPYSRAGFVLLEAGLLQPRSLSNSFLCSLHQKGDLMQKAVDALGNHMNALDAMYGQTAKQRGISTITNPREFASLDSIPLATLIDQTLSAAFTEG